MERELYRQLYRIVWAMGQSYRLPKLQHPTWRIAMVYFWAVLHDRPISWACEPANWPPGSRVTSLPSNATMSRRLRLDQTRHLIRALREHLLKGLQSDTSVPYLDGKPLPVDGLSGDPDATLGYGAGTVCRGYKLHALCDQQGLLVT